MKSMSKSRSRKLPKSSRQKVENFDIATTVSREKLLHRSFEFGIAWAKSTMTMSVSVGDDDDDDEALLTTVRHDC